MRVVDRFWGVLGRVCLISGACVALLSGLLPSRAAAQEGADVEDCQIGEAVVFDFDSTTVNLAAQAKLNQALQWLLEAPGRHLLILGADGPRPNDARLGKVRASAAVLFMITSGANPAVVSRGGFRDLEPNNALARVDVDSIVLVTCDVTEPSP
jgi:hypothetical protein